MGSPLGTAIGTFSGIQNSKANERIQQQTIAFNKQVAEQNARLSRERAAEEAEIIRRETDLLIGRQQASFAASGVLTTDGSPLLAQMEQAREGEIEALKTLRRGEIEAQGFENESRFRTFESQVAGIRGKQERVQIGLSGIRDIASSATSLLTGGQG